MTVHLHDGPPARPRRAPAIFLAIILLASLTGLCGCPKPTAQRQAVQPPASSTVSLRAEVKRLKEENRVLRQKGTSAQISVALYFMTQTPAEMFLQPVVVTLPAGQKQPDAALRALIAGPPAGSPLKPVLPKTTKVLGVTTQSGVARANFSSEIKTLNVGSRGEALAVAAIANTLIKFPDIERVQILIDGSRTETLAGHVDISQPVARNDTVVMLPAAGTAGTAGGTAKAPTVSWPASTPSIT